MQLLHFLIVFVATQRVHVRWILSVAALGLEIQFGWKSGLND